MIAALVVPGPCSADNLREMEGDWGMSDDNKGVRGPAAKLTTSEKWGDPPIWSPWNFQFPNPNREKQKHVSREAQANAHARDEAK